MSANRIFELCTRLCKPRDDQYVDKNQYSTWFVGQKELLSMQFGG